MMLDWSRLFPSPDAITPPRIVPLCFFVLIAAISTVRSLLHMFLPDGGAHSIAGLATDVAGGGNLIALFAQWGASQLLLALIYWVVILRYRVLTPLMLLIILLEQLLRQGMGMLKPIVAAAPPPGAYYTHALLPLSAVMLIWSLWPAPRRGAA